MVDPWRPALQRGLDFGSPASARAIGLECGAYHACVALDNSELRCWGRDQDGQIGDGQADDGVVDLGFLGSPIAGLALSSSTTCVWAKDGKARCWGDT